MVTAQAVTVKVATTKAAEEATRVDLVLWTVALLITAITAVPTHVKTTAMATRAAPVPLTRVTRIDMSPAAAIGTVTWTEAKIDAYYKL